MIKTYNPKEMKKWMEYTSILAGIIFTILGLLRTDGTLFVLGFFFILVVSNKTEIIIDQEGLVIKTSTLFLFKRKKRLNFNEIDSVSISKGNEKALIYFMTGWKGRKVLIDLRELVDLEKLIKSRNPELLKNILD